MGHAENQGPGDARSRLSSPSLWPVGSFTLLYLATATLLVPETNVGGYLNTGRDLVSNTLGASVVAALIWLRGRMDGRR